MREIARPSYEIKSTGVYTYIDKIQVWFRRRLSLKEIAQLRSECGGKLHVRDKPAKFDHRLRMRLQLNQPSRQALRWIASLDDAHLNYVEFAIDLTFDDEDARDEAWDFLCRFIVKSHHRDQGIRFVKGKTRYSGRRGAPNLLVVYRDRSSKVTHDRFCLHVEWRISGIAVLRRAGIHGVADLIDFDHREFWRTRFTLSAVDPERLGRLYWNYFHGTSRRKPWTIRSGKLRYDVDRRLGSILIRYYSTQDVIDRFRGKIDVRSCLVPLTIVYDLCRHLPDTPPNALAHNEIVKPALSHRQV
jgi:hypothetical protein